MSGIGGMQQRIPAPWFETFGLLATGLGRIAILASIERFYTGSGH